MKQILTFEPQKKNPNRVNIFINDQFLSGLDLIVCQKLNLHNQMDVSESMVSEILAYSGFEVAKLFALRSLSKSEQAAAMIKKKLELKGYSEEIIDRVIDECIAQNYINDERFAKAFISDKVKLKHWGQKRIKIELTRKGISPTLIEKCLPEFFADNTINLKIIEKIIKKFSPLSEVKNREKAVRFLLYRGYEWDQINRMLLHINL